jgi:hypothetical protein
VGGNERDGAIVVALRRLERDQRILLDVLNGEL